MNMGLTELLMREAFTKLFEEKPNLKNNLSWYGRNQSTNIPWKNNKHK